jgi:outer membrane protein assembly factor BamB
MIPSRRLLAAAAFLVIWCAPAFAQENWPQFRGPGSRGHAESDALPLKWAENQNVKWKAPIHDKGWSSPVVWGNQVWLTTATEDGRELFALCIDKETGKIVHDLKLFEVPNPNPVFKRYNSYASPTPAIEQGRIYVSFGASGIACLDTRTGQRVWARRDINVNHYRGAGSSLVIWQNLLLTHFDGVDAQFVIALNKENGDTVWKTPRTVDYKDIDAKTGKPFSDGDLRKAFSTPVITEVDGKPLMLSLASRSFYAYDPASGKEVWRLDNQTSHSGSSTPVVGHGLVFCAMGFDRQEVMAIRPTGSGTLSDADIAWRFTRNAPRKPSLLLAGDLLYMVDDSGIAACVEARTGKDVWRQRLKGNFSASPLHAAGRVYFFGDSGTTTVVEAGREYKVLAENTLEDQAVMASPAVSGPALFIRTKGFLYRIQN